MSKNDQHLANVLVLQRGARHRYAIPRIYEQENRLCGLYTDSCTNSFIGKCLTFIPQNLRTNSINRICSRVVEGVPPEKIQGSDMLHFHDYRLAFSKASLKEWLAELDEVSFQQIKKNGLRDASVIYSISAAHLKSLHYASEKGLSSIVDAIIDPETRALWLQKKPGLICH